ncbi:hypothetical protein H920_10473 [Fukomys damarensis]|uniref:Uncharacterized protein n=1 Tax=Fukomys damarensis TaxID=885580 RepID=A0A091D7K6_FUKDA|nr:hypothetical protein H920_10473 [Fukomys damarensis]
MLWPQHPQEEEEEEEEEEQEEGLKGNDLLKPGLGQDGPPLLFRHCFLKLQLRQKMPCGKSSLERCCKVESPLREAAFTALCRGL